MKINILEKILFTLGPDKKERFIELIIKVK